jgi:flavin-binding protein dodecin
MMKKEPEKETHMEQRYKKIEIVGSSETSFGEAAQNAVAQACQSLRHVD